MSKSHGTTWSMAGLDPSRGNAMNHSLVVMVLIPRERSQRGIKTPLAECTRSTVGSLALHSYRVSQIVTRLRSSRSARHERELRSSLSALGRCSLEGLQSTLAVPVLDGTLVVPVPDSTAIGRTMCDLT